MSTVPLRALVVAVISTALLVPAAAGADDLDDELRRVSERIDEVAAQIDDVTASRSAIAGDIKAASAQLDDLSAALTVAAGELDAIGRRVARQDAALGLIREELRVSYTRLAATREALSAQRSKAVDAARRAYVEGTRGLTVWSISATRITDVSVGLEYLGRVSRIHRDEIEAFTALEAEEAAEQAIVAVREADAAADLAELQALQASLAAVNDEYLSRRRDLEEGIALRSHLLATLEEEIAHFEEELDVLAEEQTTIKALVADGRTSSSVVVAEGQFVRPVPGRITSPFGPRYHPILGYNRMHTGIDLAASRGQRIKAAADGIVTLARTRGGYGLTVVIDHGGGLSTLYAHQSALLVSKGDVVEAGSIIGRVGSSGLATGPHLHFEVRVDGDPVDPVPFLEGG